MKTLTVDEAMLTAYFTSQNFLFKSKQSIANLAKYYNELRAEIAANGKSKHPDSWSLEHENKLSPQELPDYWKHLRSLGLEPKKDRVGKTVDWVTNAYGEFGRSPFLA